MLQYQYNCVSPLDIEELTHIVENSIEITYRTFITKVDRQTVEDFNKGFCIPLDKDWSVSFHKSTTPEGKIVYYFRHSGIEYIFY